MGQLTSLAFVNFSGVYAAAPSDPTLDLTPLASLRYLQKLDMSQCDLHAYTGGPTRDALSAPLSIAQRRQR
jgi:hypothetical protein